MRALSVVALATLATACSSNEELRFTSTLDADVSSLILSADGLDAVAGMIGMTCTIDTNWGCPVSDTDLPTEDERIVDVRGTTTLATSSEGIHTIRGAEYVITEDVAMTNVRTAGLYGVEQHVTLAGTLGETCLFQVGDASVSVFGEACAPEMVYSYDRDNGRVFAAGNGAVYALTAGGATQLSDAHDLASWDVGTEAVYVAQKGGFDLGLIRPSGETVWSITTSEPIVSIVARGGLGQVVVLTETTDGYGLVQRFDGADGKKLGQARVPDAQRTLEASDNGAKLAMLADGEVHFYEMGKDIEALPVDDTPVDCIVPTQTRRVSD